MGDFWFFCQFLENLFYFLHSPLQYYIIANPGFQLLSIYFTENKLTSPQSLSRDLRCDGNFP